MVSGPSPAPSDRQAPQDARRHPAAVAAAITAAWRPYRWRAYGGGLLAGLLIGGVGGPIVTTSMLMALAMAGVTSEAASWPNVVWSLAFALSVPVVGATLYAYWQPRRLRMAAQTYLWVAQRAEAHWAEVMRARPVPRDERGIRQTLASMPGTPETARERFGLWLALLETDNARAAAAEIPGVTDVDRFSRPATLWLVDFVEGSTAPPDALQSLADAISDPDDRVEATAIVAVNRARVAISEDRDWQAPLTAVRPSLGDTPERIHNRFLWWAAFRALLVSMAVGVAVFWARSPGPPAVLPDFCPVIAGPCAAPRGAAGPRVGSPRSAWTSARPVAPVCGDRRIEPVSRAKKRRSALGLRSAA